MPLNPNPRIVLNDETTVEDALITLAEGNPGAVSVLLATAERYVDEPREFGLFLLRLDDLGIYGPAIWFGYKNVCGGDLEKFITQVGHEPSFPEMIKEAM